MVTAFAILAMFFLLKPGVLVITAVVISTVGALSRPSYRDNHPTHPSIHPSIHSLGVAGAFTFLFFSVSAEATNSIPENNSSDANLVAACVCPAGNSAHRSGGQANINIRHTPIHPCINNQYILVVYTYVMYPIYVIDISP